MSFLKRFDVRLESKDYGTLIDCFLKPWWGHCELWSHWRQSKHFCHSSIACPRALPIPNMNRASFLTRWLVVKKVKDTTVSLLPPNNQTESQTPLEETFSLTQQHKSRMKRRKNFSANLRLKEVRRRNFKLRARSWVFGFTFLCCECSEPSASQRNRSFIQFFDKV